MVLESLEHNELEAQVDSSEPLLEKEDADSALLHEYRWKSEDSTEEEMAEMLEESLGNHFWTNEEKQCLVYYYDKCDGDLERLHREYFTHRSAAALGIRFKAIQKGAETPATTPRLSISAASEMTKKVVNKTISMLTPKKPTMETQQTEEELDPLNLDDEEELEEMIEEEEAEIVKEETQENEETEVNEQETDAPKVVELEPISPAVYLLTPLIMIFFGIAALIFLPEEMCPEPTLTAKRGLTTSIETFVNAVMQKLKDLKA